MEMSPLGWFVAAIAILLTGISKSGLGGALGGLAVPFMAIWISPRDAAAVMLPVLITMDFAGMRAWKGRADRESLKVLIPGAAVGIAIGTLGFDLFSDRILKLFIGVISLLFCLNRLRQKSAVPTSEQRPPAWFGWLFGAGAGLTSTLAHAGGPPVMMYLLSWKQNREVYVATSVYFFTFVNLAKLPGYLALGLFHRETLLMSVLFLPLVPVGVWAGLRLLKRIPERYFYLIGTYGLGLAGVKLVWDALA